MTTHPATDGPDLAEPIWTIAHVAAALHLSVDAAREYTYRADFPAARAGFARNLWLREEVLGWFAALPARTAGDTTRRRTSASPAARAGGPTGPTGLAPRSRRRSYSPRRTGGGVAS